MDWETVINSDYPTACRVVRRRMLPWLRSGFDADDFVSQALVALLRYPELDYHSPNTLVLISLRKMLTAGNRWRVELLPDDYDASDRAPTAEQAAIAAELKQRLLDRYQDPRDKAAIRLRSEGFSLPDIAELTGRSPRTIERFFRQCRLDHAAYSDRRPVRYLTGPSSPAVAHARHAARG